MSVPIFSLYEYQRRWVEDQARRKAALWSRSAGKTASLTLEPAIDVQVAEAKRQRCEWAFFSASEEQTREMILYAARHCQAIDLGAELYEEEHDVLDEATERKHRVSMLALRFEHGSRILGLPTNPYSIRGKHMNLVGDEAGHWPNADKLWQAAGGIALRGFKIRLSGTAGEPAGPFYEICEGIRPGWSVHKVDIHQAIAQGAPITLEDARAIAGSGYAFAVEFELQWETSGSRWLSLEDISACESFESPLVCPELVIADDRAADWQHHLDGAAGARFPYDEPEAWRRLFAPLRGRPNLYLGYDVARTRDFAVLSVVQRDGYFDRLRALVAFKGQRFGIQRGALFAAMSHCRRGCIDATGLGMQLAEESEEHFGAVVEKVKFTAGVKEDMAVRLRRRIAEDRSLTLPRSTLLRESLHSVYKLTTAAGNARYDADATDAKGHADHFWSLGLAELAAGDGSGVLQLPSSFGASRYSREEGLGV